MEWSWSPGFQGGTAAVDLYPPASLPTLPALNSFLRLPFLTPAFPRTPQALDRWAPAFSGEQRLQSRCAWSLFCGGRDGPCEDAAAPVPHGFHFPSGRRRPRFSVPEPWTHLFSMVFSEPCRAVLIDAKIFRNASDKGRLFMLLLGA